MLELYEEAKRLGYNAQRQALLARVAARRLELEAGEQA
jgi:hypothetical protein